jgi:hypothetical protein
MYWQIKGDIQIQLMSNLLEGVTVILTIICWLWKLERDCQQLDG